MKKAIMIVMVLATAMGAAYASGFLGFSNEKLRYKVTVVVETPEGEKIGSAVREAGKYTEPRILPEQGGVFYNVTRGEAVVVDLEERGVLFALLGGQGEAENVFKLLSGQSDNKVVLSPEQYPQFVRFRDLKDPKTVEAVKLGELSEVVRIKEIVFVTTNDPVTWAIARWLPWLPNYYNRMFDGQRYNMAKSKYPFANSLSSGSFSTGDPHER